MPSMPGDPRWTAEWKRLRAQLIARASTCAICGRWLDKDAPPRTRWRPTVDHIVPLARGGDPYDPGNLRVVHNRCNVIRENTSRRGGQSGLPTRRRWHSRDW